MGIESGTSSPISQLTTTRMSTRALKKNWTISLFVRVILVHRDHANLFFDLVCRQQDGDSSLIGCHKDQANQRDASSRLRGAHANLNGGMGTIR